MENDGLEYKANGENTHLVEKVKKNVGDCRAWRGCGTN